MNDLSILRKYEEYCGENNLPRGRDLPYFRNDNVLDESFLSEVHAALATIPGKMRADGIMKDYAYIGMANLTFDESYQITDTQYLVPNPIRYYEPSGTYTPSEAVSDTLTKLRTTLVQQFASELDLTGTHQIWMNCFGYRLRDGESAAPLPWHDDLNDSWTGVTMLTNPDSPHGWTGGNLQLAPSRLTSSKIGPPIASPIVEELVEIPSRYNASVFFHNYGTKHTVTPMTGKIAHAATSDENNLEDLFSERIIWCIEDHCRPNCRKIQATRSHCMIS